jgi:hypothetical protein
MKILVLGDTHGDLDAVREACTVAVRRGCTTILQLGDFGFGWDLHLDPGLRFPARVNNLAKRHKLRFYWLCGNHEQFDVLEQVVDMTSSEPQKMGSHLWYLPRGCMVEWDGCKILALGGAYSIDKDYRTPHVSWWPQETLSASDVERALRTIDERGRPHVMITHDAPEGVFPYPLFLGGTHGDLSRRNREAVRAVYQAATPLQLIHGHYHRRYDQAGITGLDCNGSGDKSWMILDTADLTD